MRTFFTIAFGQFISLVGSSLTGFALGIWVFQETGSVTLLSLIFMMAMVPGTILAPFAGALVDRGDRKTIMLLADSVAAVTTLAVALLVLTGRQELWNIFVLVTVGSVAKTFQVPAYVASVPLLVPKRHLGRAVGLAQLNQAMATALAPLLAGFLIARVGIGGVLIIDLATFVVAMMTLLVVRIPRPEESEAGRQAKGSLGHEVASGWRYIRARPGFIGLLMVFTSVGFILAMANVLYVPLLLSFTSSEVLGLTVSAGGVGLAIGSLLVVTRGVPERKVLTVMVLLFAGGILMSATGFQRSAIPIAVILLTMMVTVPVARGAYQVLWQTKVPPDMQGRVIALRNMLAQCSPPAAYLLAGPLADRVFEPFMTRPEAVSTFAGRLLGAGPGRGIALMFVLAGLIIALIAVLGYLHPRIRNLEQELPDAVDETTFRPAAPPAPEPAQS